MTITTIKVDNKIKSELDKLRQYKNESYNEIIIKMLKIVKYIEEDKTELSEEIIREIEKAREEIRRSDFYTEKEVNEKFGMSIK